MSDVVLDSSAILAVLNKEPGSERIEGDLSGALVSAVNLAEVVGKLVDNGLDEVAARDAIHSLGLVVVPFDPENAWAAGFLRKQTREHGLSLGDRACLTLAFSRRIPAVTTDRSWAKLRLGAAVRVVGR